MISSSRPLSRKDQLVVQEHDEEVLVYDLRSNKAFCLNTTAALIWQACDGRQEISEISNLVANALDEPESEALVWLALDRLKKENLMEEEDLIAARFNGLSRREVIKKLGITSMAALPVIASLVAPTSASAVSSCMVVLGGCLCGLGTFPAGTFCTGMILIACAANCRCRSNGFLAADDCVP
jgi:hypothetical protein